MLGPKRIAAMTLALPPPSRSAAPSGAEPARAQPPQSGVRHGLPPHTSTIVPSFM